VAYFYRRSGFALCRLRRESIARKHVIPRVVRVVVLILMTNSVLNAKMRLEPQTSVDEQFSAQVFPSEARFVIPITTRARWKWHADSVRDNAREYQISVSVRNNTSTYYFGFYMWKYPGSGPRQGDFRALVSAGQSSLFENKDPHHNVIIKNAGVKVEPHSDKLVVKVTGKENVERLFSSRPSEVTFNIVIPDEQDISKKVSVEYRDKK
jgi:hypothetical protein